MANCLSRPPDVLSLPRSTKEASIKVPYRSLAVPVAWDGSPGASTVAVVTPGPVLDMVELAHAQESCKETQELRAKLDAQDVLNAHQGPQDLVRQLPGCVFNSMHSLAHPGICATRPMLTSRFIWTGCSSDVNTWCPKCQQSARAKV